MIGETNYLLDLWSCLPWDYSKNGLLNLYRNLKHKEVDIDSFLKQKSLFVNPEDIGWVTLEHNWNADLKSLEDENELNHIWGKPQGYSYYGGF